VNAKSFFGHVMVINLFTHGYYLVSKMWAIQETIKDSCSGKLPGLDIIQVIFSSYELEKSFLLKEKVEVMKLLSNLISISKAIIQFFSYHNKCYRITKEIHHLHENI
jgi:hypothetical protein